MEIKYDVFISYSRKDYVDEQKNIIEGNAISQIKEAFNEANISYWFDEDGIYSGDKYMAKLADAIAESSVLLFVSSINSNASEWTAGEIGTAHLYKKKIIPFRLDESPFARSIIVKIASLNFIEYYQNREKALSELVKSITAYKGELEQKRIENEERIKQQELLARKKEVKAEISSLVSDYKRLSSQLQIYVNQIYEKKDSICEKTKKCLVCDKELDIRALYCDRCGWQFPILFALDTSSDVFDDIQLSIARVNWNSVGNVVELQATNKDLQKFNFELEKGNRNLANSNDEISKQNEKLNRHLATMDSQIAQLQNQIDNQQSLLEKSKKKLSEQEKEFLQETGRHQVIVADFEKQVSSLISKLSQKEQENRDLTAQILNLQKAKIVENSIKVDKKKETVTTKSKETSVDIEKMNLPIQGDSILNKKIKAIKSPEDAFAIIESCCDRNPIQDNFDFNRAKLRLGKLKTMLGKKYNVYISKTAIIAC